jgi:hypothetical protein
MIILSKYFSKCSCCNKNINVGSRIEWEKGKPAFHVECVQNTPEQLISLFKETHKSGSIDFINAENDIYTFKWIMKSGKEKLIQYYKNGERYYGKESTSILGVR